MLRLTRRVLCAAGSGPFDPYKILGVKPDASKSDIKKAYHRLALRFHPDSGAEGNAARFAAVNEAYEAVKDGTWKPTAWDQAKAAEHGGGGWDPKMRMYVYEQPGSTTEGYVTGDTEKYLRVFMIGCFVFIALRLSLFFLMPARKRNAAAQGGGEAPGEADGAASTTAFGLPATPPGQPAAPFTAGGYGSGSVHADDEVEYKWGDAASASAPMKDPLSHR